MSLELLGVVFDMDGVIIESEFTHYSAICEAMGEEMDQTYETFLSKCTGGDERFAMGRLAELSGIEYDESIFQEWSRKKAVAYQRLVGESATPMPGAVESFVQLPRSCRLDLLPVQEGRCGCGF